MPGIAAQPSAASPLGEPIPYDDPAIQQARRDVLDSVRCVGAITVATRTKRFADDPFARLFPLAVVESDLFCPVPPPPGRAIERYTGVAWPGRRF